MKKIILALGLLVGCATVVTQLSACPGYAWATALPNAAFLWTKTTADFGRIKQHVPVTHRFTFTNNGDSPLVISSVQASCGCTVTEYSKDPIEPGGEGFVKATYNAAKLGVFAKTVTVQANTEERVAQLSIKGVVIE